VLITVSVCSFIFVHVFMYSCVHDIVFMRSLCSFTSKNKESSKVLAPITFYKSLHINFNSSTPQQHNFNCAKCYT
jgi:hypothetical protein